MNGERVKREDRAVTNDARQLHAGDEVAMSPRVARSRANVLQAATELLVESGPRSVTVDAVVEASGVAKSTLYRHWSSRTELLIDVIRCSSPRLEAPDRGRGFEPALRSYLAAAAASFADPDWVRIFPSVASLRTSIPELDELFAEDIAEKKRAMDELLSLGVAERMIPTAIDFDDAASMLIGPIFFAALTRPTGPSTEGELIGLASRVVDHFIASCGVVVDEASSRAGA